MQETVSTYVGQLGEDGLIRINGVPATNSPTFDVFAGSRFSQPLHRVLPIDPKEFRSRVGTYTDNDITVVVTMNAQPASGEPYAFYADLDHNALVRLYSVSDDRMLSEQGEELKFHADGTLTLAIDGCQTLLQPAQLPASEAVEFPVPDSGATAVGTLLRPDVDTTVPAVVIGHSTIAAQRDFYRGFAACFLRAGIAVLMFDHTGDAPHDTSDSAGLVGALDYLGQRDDIGRLGMWGLGDGMRAVSTVAAKRDELAFVAGMSAPGVSESRGKEKHDPAAPYSDVSCPVLLQYGAVDSVISAERSAKRIAEALAKGGNDSHTITTYDEAGYLLERVPTGVDADAWARTAARLHGIRFRAGALSELTDWVASTIEESG
ncbi:MAG TPA: hypothetical protein H9902_12150 [Candidatus Stackebrandtia faecavium]|nr:hypothetical protein [Candidatus Stackebrandtia faecavium]